MRQGVLIKVPKISLLLNIQEKVNLWLTAIFSNIYK